MSLIESKGMPSFWFCAKTLVVEFVVSKKAPQKETNGEVGGEARNFAGGDIGIPPTDSCCRGQWCPACTMG